MLPMAVASEVERSLLDYLRTSLGLRADEVSAALEAFLKDEERGLFRGPFIELSLPFRMGEPAGGAEAESPLRVRPSYTPFAHQLRAWERLASGGGRTPTSTLVTTGTGSGKTECFLFPVLDHCLREREAGNLGIKAILLYPMNALASDQARRVHEELSQHPLLQGGKSGEGKGEKGHPPKVSAGIYVGGRGKRKAFTRNGLIDDRQTLRESPPDILITNYRMLDLLLMRPADRPLWRHNDPETLRYVVLDEMHTYDGAQGSDVACLLRRLKARLDTPEGHLVGVGTSATIGSGDTDSQKRLATFASDLFGEEVDTSALILEDRLTYREWLAREPQPDGAETLTLDWLDDPLGARRGLIRDARPENYADQADYLKKQIELWFGEPLTREETAALTDAQKEARRREASALYDDRHALGMKLRQHRFLHSVLRRAAEGHGPKHWRDVIPRLPDLLALRPEEQRLVLGSFLALVAHARSGTKKRPRPFLSLRVQQWIREVRRLVREVRPLPSDDEKKSREPEALAPAAVTLAWHEDKEEDAEGRVALPMAHCRACGLKGFAAAQRKREPGEEAVLENNPRVVGEAYLFGRGSARFVRLGAHRDGAQLDALHQYLCPVCLTVTLDPERHACIPRDGAPPKPVLVTLTGPAKDHDSFDRACPDCHAVDSLSIVGARNASLSSVAVSQLFLSPFAGEGGEDLARDGRKLIAFTDSVQDASHRAGFFAGRTYRFNLRTAIQTTLMEAGGALALGEVGTRLLAHFTETLGADVALSTFLPPDLAELPVVEAYKRSATAKNAEKVREALLKRLSWEVMREYGLGLTAGRGLDRSGVSTLRYDEDALTTCAEDLLSYLHEEERPFLRLELDVQNVRHYLRGLLDRLRRRGGFMDPLLREYAYDGNQWKLSKRRNPLLPGVGGASVLPRFFVTGTRTHKTFDVVSPKATTQSWLRLWTCDTLMMKFGEHLSRIVERALRVLAAHDLLHIVASGKQEVFGLNPARLALTTDTQILTCSRCKLERTAPASDPWEDERCTAHRCGGRFVQTTAKSDYYAKLYQTKRVRRVFTAEHTGLLARDDRERLEERFKQGKEADAPNVLTCTPTLEMGIDVGDLSSVMLCSVPPRTSNYLQRVGRAGRKTGNAYVAVFANAAPHDLYFHGEPLEMMDGEVRPPGVFLDSVEILRRQLIAHALDHFSQHVPTAHIPRTMGEFLNSDDFMTSFTTHYEQHREAITARFFSRFGASMKDTTRDELMRSTPRYPIEALDKAFDNERKAMQELRKHIDDVRKQLKKLEDPTAQADVVERGTTSGAEERLSYEERVAIERDDLETHARSYGRALKERRSKHPLNALTDAGVLPNYAFPEPGVLLRAVLREPKVEEEGGQKRGRRRPKTQEDLRPAATAIRELAPYNTFYAQGHRIKVSQIYLGTKSEPNHEDWRFCPSCHYHQREERAAEEQGALLCPRCGDAEYGDTGQVVRMLVFKRAESSVPKLEAGITDGADDREQESYHVVELMDVNPEEVAFAHASPTGAHTVFGYEFIRALSVRQINCGLRSDVDAQYAKSFGGQRVMQGGFVVCEDCGRVRGKKRGSEIAHAPWCPVRTRGDKESRANLFLSRAFTSEALRLLLPVIDEGVNEFLPNFRAAIQLGFREYFGGHPEHLRVTTMSEGSGRRRRNYLVIYDEVPGGSGYVEKLAKDGVLFDVMKAAVKAMQACTHCEDGCYRCLLAYQERREQAQISRRRAVEVFDELLAYRGALVKRDNLSSVDTADLLESELEWKFVRRLQRESEKRGATFHMSRYQQNNDCWVLHFGEGDASVTWNMWKQQTVTDTEHETRPDFLLQRDDGSGLEVAIYCDGLAFHVQPHLDHARLAGDVRKRRALLAGTPPRRVFTLTWHDLEEGSEVSGLWKKGSLDLLLAYLKHPDERSWRDEATEAADALIVPSLCFGKLAYNAFETALRTDASRVKAPSTQARPELMATLHERTHSAITVQIPIQAKRDNDLGKATVTVRLFDSKADRVAATFREEWRRFFLDWNLLQFHPGAFVTTSAALLEEPGYVAPEPPPPIIEDIAPLVQTTDGAVATEMGDVVAAHPDLASLLREPVVLELEPPREGMDAGLPEYVTLAWEDAKVALVYGLESLEQQELTKRGYRAFDYEATCEEPSALLAAMRGAR